MGDDWVVAVTGAASGVGRAVVRELGARGALVGLVARNAEALEAARREVEDAGGRAVVAICDMADADAVEAAAAAVEDALGPIDAWINNAMTTVFAPFWEVSAAEYRRATDVTYLGYVHGTMAALRRMRPRGHGTIVQVGSALAYRSIPLQAPYCGAKHAIHGFSQSLRCELMHEHSRIRLSEVHLPGLNTPQFEHCLSRMPNDPQPVPPIYQPEVAARAIVWAAEHGRREVWVGGSTAATILANRIAPGLLDRYLARTNVRAQQTDRPADPDRPANLFSPIPGDAGAHGPFDERARSRSGQSWLSLHRRPIGIAATAGALALTIARARQPDARPRR